MSSSNNVATLSQNGAFVSNILPFPESLRGKRLLLATESLGPVNGVSRTTSNLIEYLRKNGVEIAIVAPQQGHLPGATTAVQGNAKELEIRLKGYPLPYDPTLSVVFPFRLDRLFDKTFNPDIIYLASPASLGFQVLLQLRQLRHQPPVLLNFQTDLSAYCEILFPRPLDNWAVWVFRSVQGYLFRHSAVRTVFYPSSYVAKYLTKAGVQENKMEILRRGVNRDLFSPDFRDEAYRRQLAPNKELILVCVARLAPEKGFEFLAQVAQALAERKFPFHLLIVGGNRSPVVAESIREYFNVPSLRGKVTFTGLLQGSALGRAYASADIFLHCSITETFGLVVLESMASGVPVIARDEGGPSDTVQHGTAGFLVPPHDLEGFVNCVEDLGRNAELREAMRKRGLELAVQASWEKINNQVAWKLAEALSQDEDADAKSVNSTTPLRQTKHRSDHYSTRPVMGVLSAAAEKARITGSLVIINGVWVGVVITWGLAQVVLFGKKLFQWRN